MMTKFLLITFTAMAVFYGCESKKDVQPSSADSTKTTAVLPKQQKTSILFLGTSLTAALGLDPSEGYPANIQKKIDSLKLPYECINGGVSGETTSGLLSRLDWMLQGEIAVIVIESGANDGLRGTEVGTTRNNLIKIIEKCRLKYPNAKILLAGMRVPPNMGPEYTKEFERIYPELSQQFSVPLVPFLLKNVGGIPELNQPDRIHPTAKGQKIVAENVWQYLQPLL